MSRMPPNLTRSRPENTTFFAVRQTFSLITFGVHISLLGSNGSAFFWLCSLAYICFFPALMFLAPVLRDNAKRNLLIDTSLHGFFFGLWGFNPLLCTIYCACINIVNMTSGGVSFGLRGIGLLIVAALVGGSLSGFYFRPELPLSTLIPTCAGLLLFISILGIKIYKINLRLRQARSNLEQQTEELTRLNHLATIINANLNIDVIMENVMKSIEELYPFEAMYILTFQDQQKRLDVSGIYGSSALMAQHRQFKDLSFLIPSDENSLFVQALLQKRVVHIPLIDPKEVINAAPKDKALFALRPSQSLAYFPIFINDQVIGGACFINYKTPFTLSKTDILKIQEYLVHVGTAVRNTAQFEELSKAKEIAVKAQSKAEASEETKSRFLANMSHEIRTPLTAIMGYSEALQEDNIDAHEQSIFVTNILRSSHHLLTMINDILDISKIEAHKVEIENIRCNLIEPISDIESYLAIKCKEKGLTCRTEVTYPLPQTIRTDPTRLKQILFNLCNNAIKFTDKGSITLKISTQNNDILKFSVSDTGIGISEEARDKIFNAFDQADTSTTRLFGGTGLGLFISQNLAKLLGGQITLESTEGTGTTFTLTMPIQQDTAEPRVNIDSESQYKELLKQTQKSTHSSGIPTLVGRVLLAEDNLENQNLITRLIKQTGMKVDIVSNGQSAVAAALKNTYELILLDMQMPIMGGQEAAKIIQAENIKTPIIAFTANVMKHQLDDYKKLGFVDVLEKPIIKEKLFKTLKDNLDKSTHRPQVLIAEDNEVNQLILHRYVNKACKQALVTIAQNGQEAIQYVDEQHFDLILMDMKMPIVDGLKATKAIREAGYTLPIYIVTGNVDIKSKQLCMDAGANGHLPKPLEKDKVIDLIKSVLN